MKNNKTKSDKYKSDEAEKRKAKTKNKSERPKPIVPEAAVIQAPSVRVAVLLEGVQGKPDDDSDCISTYRLSRADVQIIVDALQHQYLAATSPLYGLLRRLLQWQGYEPD